MRKTIVVIGCAALFLLTGCYNVSNINTNNESNISSSTCSNINSDTENSSVISSKKEDESNSDRHGDETSEDGITSCFSPSSESNVNQNSSDFGNSQESSSSVEPGKGNQDGSASSIPSNTDQNPSSTENLQGNLSDVETSQAIGVIEIGGERELNNKGSRRGQIAPSHKLPLGTIDLAAGTNATFGIKCARKDAKLKIVFTGNKSGVILEDTVMGSDNVTFEIKADDKYSVTVENASDFDVDFTLEYFIGGSL